MIGTVVITIICLLAVLVALHRLATMRTVGPYAHYLSATLLCFGLGRLARTPVISDEWVDGWFHSWSGVWNVTDFLGMALAAVGAIFLVHTVAGIFGRPISTPLLIGSIGAAVAGMGATFALSPVPHAPTAFMSRDFDMTGWFAIYWLIYLSCLGFATGTVALLAGRAAAVFRPGAPRTAVASLAIAGLFGLMYVTHKVVNLTVEYFDVWGWYSEHAPHISLATLACALLSGVLGLLLMLSAAVGRRVGRFRLLRDRVQEWRDSHAHAPDVSLDDALMPSGSIWSLWKATRDPVVAHRMLVELADSKA